MHGIATSTNLMILHLPFQHGGILINCLMGFWAKVSFCQDWDISCNILKKIFWNDPYDVGGVVQKWVAGQDLDASCNLYQSAKSLYLWGFVRPPAYRKLHEVLVHRRLHKTSVHSGLYKTPVYRGFCEDPHGFTNPLYVGGFRRPLNIKYHKQ